MACEHGLQRILHGLRARLQRLCLLSLCLASFHGTQAMALDACARRAQLLYVPSWVEMEWMGNMTTGICARSHSQVAASRHWLKFAQDSVGPNATRPPTSDEALILSSFVTSSNRSEYIEPLTGIARHPFASVGCHDRSFKSVSKFEIRHLVLPNLCGEAVRCSQSQRNLFYDLGCATYAGKVDLQQGSGGGPSIPLFHALFGRNCIHFNQTWAWEARKYNLDKWWSYVPESLKGKLHFFNQPVTPSDFFSTLRSTARPEDYVVLKVDIDTPEVEVPIVRELLIDSELGGLVDELFFEYHFLTPEFRNMPAWAGQMGAVNASYRSTVVDAMHLMHSLRVHGIRSHFWI